MQDIPELAPFREMTDEEQQAHAKEIVAIIERLAGKENCIERCTNGKESRNYYKRTI